MSSGASERCYRKSGVKELSLTGSLLDRCLCRNLRIVAGLEVLQHVRRKEHQQRGNTQEQPPRGDGATRDAGSTGATSGGASTGGTVTRGTIVVVRLIRVRRIGRVDRIGGVVRIGGIILIRVRQRADVDACDFVGQLHGSVLQLFHREGIGALAVNGELRVTPLDTVREG